ncbi:topoisomerase DNA-binding C4 zinc finger domain-containing protein [Nitrococcus mobilis]|uniref:topoisomerase DNA-binding C4 zinc finger domain-containing protein n=1 Tax=Nitrococcus mobilis TaxID=35797 RepID=UPI0009FEE6EC
MNTLLLAVIVIVIVGGAVFLVLTKGKTRSAITDIRRQIEGAISRKKSPTTKAAAHASRVEAMERLRANAGPRSAPEAAKVQHRKTITLASEVPKGAAPDCPKCGAAMVLQKSKLGGNAGQEFWGCSTFPKCRGVTKRNA